VFDINIGGLVNAPQVLAELNALSNDLKEQALRAGVAEVAKSGLLQLKSTAPVDTGGVKESLNRKLVSKRWRNLLDINDGTVAMLVGPNRRVRGFFRSRIANVLEGGARAHIIRAGKSGALREFQYAQGIRTRATSLYSRKLHRDFGPVVNHPGISPRMFMARADAALAGSAENLFYQGLAGFLDRHRS
jgi:hypothetical protein